MVIELRLQKSATARSDNGTTLGRLDFVTTSRTSLRSKFTCSHLRLSSSSQSHSCSHRHLDYGSQMVLAEML